MTKYRAYSETKDNTGYLSYRPNDVFNYDLATHLEFRNALDESKRQVMASGSGNLNDITILDKAIKTVVEKDGNVSNWCKGKHICLRTLFPEYTNQNEEIDLPE